MKHILTSLLLSACSLTASSQTTQGWRTDGTGIYPDQRPPLEWSTEKNVVWATELPPSNAIPIIVGDRVFVCAEPTTLVCLQLRDGKILWQKNNDYSQILSEREWIAVQRELEQIKQLEQQKKPLRKARGDVKRQLKNNEITQATATKKLDELQAAEKQIQEKINAFKLAEKWKLPRAHGHAGYSTPTPTTDGKHIWVVFGNGIAACYDLEGKRKWIRKVDEARGGFGNTASPVLVDGKLLVHMTHLTALNAKTGEQLWQTRASGSFGTSMTVKVAGEEMLLTPASELFRLKDGERVARGRGRLAYASPIRDGRRVYFIQQQCRALEVPTELNPNEKKQELKSLWSGRLDGRRFFNSPILHQGLIYTINNERKYAVIQASDGKVVLEKELDLGKGNVYPTMALAGKHLLVSSSNGTTLVLEIGKQYKEVARNQLEEFRSAPVVHQNRIYFRTKGHLYCIGRK